MPSRPAHRPAHRHASRRTVLQWGALAAGGLAAGPGFGQAAAPVAEGDEPPRLALLIGNRDYPGGEDLPPIHKNVRDLRGALEGRGFTVTDTLDLDLPRAREAITGFVASVKQASPESTVFFYFSGHGAQVNAENLLVSARLDPKSAPAVLTDGSLHLVRDVMGLLPVRPEGLTIAVIDACRTSLKATLDGGGLNQVEAPAGCLIAFATGAGKPAIAPDNENANTFYTASLVKVLNSASGETPFQDMFRLVKADTQNTMLNHPVRILREFAQVPFIAENTRVRRRIAPRVKNAPPPAPRKDDEAVAWARLEKLVWPADVAREAAIYLKDYPGSPLAVSAQVARDGALLAAAILRRQDVRLFRRAFQAGYGLPAELLADLPKAGRGDKDAAARLGKHYAPSDGAVDKLGRFEGWMQFAAALENGIASYQLALHYRATKQVNEAAYYETLARSLGYNPPTNMDNTRK